MATPVQQLENELVTHPDRVLVVAGIGVSLATCSGHPNATWKGLLQHGLQWCQDACGTSTTTLNPFRELLAEPATPSHALITIGQFITDELKQHRTGSLGSWLAKAIGSITATDHKLVSAISSLGCKLATTNYDHMIEHGTGRSPITWRNRALATTFFRETTTDVLHLHGEFRQPESVILGARSYEEVCSDEFVRTALQGWMISNTLVFIGCGSGLEDPNFGSLLDWARKTLEDCHHSHFILVPTAEIDQWRSQLKGGIVEPIPYGTSHEYLAPFLQGLADRVHSRRISEPLSLLSASQADFDSKWDELLANREQLQQPELFRRARTFASMHWKAGGRRRVALAFSNLLTFHGGALPPRELIEFALDAAEWLLEDDLASLASEMIRTVEMRMVGIDVSAEDKARFLNCRVRCADDMCAYSETLRALEEAIPNSSANEREVFAAIQCEIHFLQGDYAWFNDGAQGES